MKNLAIFKNEICLIAGSGLFVNEVADFLKNKKLLNQIILINKNNLIKKNFKDNLKSFKIQDIEKIILYIKSKNIKKVISFNPCPDDSTFKVEKICSICD